MKIYRNDDQALLSRFQLWHQTAIVVGGGAIVPVMNTGQVWAFASNQSPAVLNDQWRHPVYLKKGSYTLNMFYVKGTNQGQLLLNITNQAGPGNDYGQTIDFYNATTQLNRQFTDTGVSITRDGFFDVYGTVSGKNASSSGYGLLITMIELYRTGN